MTKKAPKSAKSFSQVQAERRARGGDSAKLADREETLFIHALEAWRKQLDRDGIDIGNALDSFRIKQAQAKGGRKNSHEYKHPLVWEAALVFWLNELKNANGNLKQDLKRAGRYKEAMQPFKADYASKIANFMDFNSEFAAQAKQKAKEISAKSATR